MIHWAWLIPVFCAGAALGFCNGYEFAKIAPFLVEGLKKHNA